MKLDMFEFQLNEERVNNSIKDLTARVKELRSLNNSANEICKKIATEFNKDYDDIKRHLLPIELKKYVGMTNEQLNKVGKDPIRKLRQKYSNIAPKTESHSAFLKGLINAYIEKK